MMLNKLNGFLCLISATGLFFVTTLSSPTLVSAEELLPFFDNIDNPVNVKFGGRQDLTPPPPVLNKFDQAVNQLCGKLGKVVKPTEFKTMFNSFPNVLSNIKTNVGGYIFPDRTSNPKFLEDLTNLWFNAKGFDHVFCGEPAATKIGGLHYAGRYLDLQKRGIAGISPQSVKKSEVQPGAVYSFGVSMKVGNRIVNDPFKGYGYTLNAEEILTIAAKAYKNNPSLNATPKACLLSVTDNGKTFANIFVAKKGAIRTFYPDATPNYGKTPKCRS
ncbi:MAG: EndoU domain-containing protein [Dolichospermum sp.]|nr:EndoU domain-containing protein [Dolichospermum sp.]